MSFPDVPLIVAWIFDSLPKTWPSSVHPVAWMGQAAEGLERRLFRGQARPEAAFASGLVMTLGVLALSVGSVWLIRTLSPSPLFTIVLDSFVVASSATLTGLIQAGHQLRSHLEQDNLKLARASLRKLCSRDPNALSAQELAAAGIESLAENTSDSWVAPLFWYVFLGWPGMVAYRAVNTLDAMYGYRGKYEWFGKPAARLDDALNWVPARITAALLFLAAQCPKGTLWVYRRDCRKTASPNAGHPMAMMAALLGVCLTKRHHYQLGEALEPVEAKHLLQAEVLVRRAGFIAAAMAVMLSLAR